MKAKRKMGPSLSATAQSEVTHETSSYVPVSEIQTRGLHWAGVKVIMKLNSPLRQKLHHHQLTKLLSILSAPADDNFTAAVVGGIKPFLFLLCS